MRKKIPDSFYFENKDKIIAKIFELSSSRRRKDGEAREKLDFYIEYLYEEEKRKEKEKEKKK